MFKAGMIVYIANQDELQECLRLLQDDGYVWNVGQKPLAYLPPFDPDGNLHLGLDKKLVFSRHAQSESIPFAELRPVLEVHVSLEDLM